MSFTSTEFAGLMLATLGGYFMLGRQGQNWLLLAASYLFYASWDWRCLGLLVGSTGVGYATGLALNSERFARHRLALLYASNALQLTVLGLFKYYGFFTRSAAEALAALGVTGALPTLDLVLPIGISFYTFHTLSYTIDVYRREVPPTRDLVAFALFISYFPQLIAGPIARAGHLLPQTLTPRAPTADLFLAGSYLILWGYVLKVVVADNLAPVVDVAFGNPGHLTALTALLSAYAFAIQIYCDFAGYSNIARGCANLMGFTLTRNFDTPYLSAEPSEFWRRWHISLSSWLRDYLYIPLGGNRFGPAWTYVNLMLTMLLGGLWHGASWTYVLWGAYHGGLLCLYRALAPGLAANLRVAPGWRRALHQVWFFHLTCFGWVIFRAADFANLSAVLAAFTRPGLGDAGAFAKLVLVLPVAGVEFAEYRARREGVLLTLPWPVRLTVYLGCYAALVTLGKWQGAGFIYFQFLVLKGWAVKRWPAGVVAGLLIAAGEGVFLTQTPPLTGQPLFEPTADDAVVQAKLDLMPRAGGRVALVGDSSCLMGLDPRRLGTPAVNLGTLSSFTLGGYAAMTVELVARPEPPRAVVVAVLPRALAVTEVEAREFQLLGRTLAATGWRSPGYRLGVSDYSGLFERKHQFNTFPPEFGGRYAAFVSQLDQSDGFRPETKSEINIGSARAEFRPSPFAVESLRRLTAACREHQVPVVLWWSPSPAEAETAAYREEVRLWGEAFVASEPGVRIPRPSPPGWPPEDFATESHVNARGAERNTRELAASLAGGDR